MAEINSSFHALNSCPQTRPDSPKERPYRIFSRRGCQCRRALQYHFQARAFHVIRRTILAVVSPQQPHFFPVGHQYQGYHRLVDSGVGQCLRYVVLSQINVRGLAVPPIRVGPIDSPIDRGGSGLWSGGQAVMCENPHVDGTRLKRRTKIAASKRGKPRPREVMEQAWAANHQRRVSKPTRRKMSEAARRRGARPPAAGVLWTKREEKLPRTLPHTAVNSPPQADGKQKRGAVPRCCVSDGLAYDQPTASSQPEAVTRILQDQMSSQQPEPHELFGRALTPSLFLEAMAARISGLQNVNGSPMVLRTIPLKPSNLREYAGFVYASLRDPRTSGWSVMGDALWPALLRLGCGGCAGRR